MERVELRASVVLPTYGRRDSLLRVLRALVGQNFPPNEFEVVVICDGDVDGSQAACRALAPTLPYALHTVVQPNQGAAAARNSGVKVARAPLIVFLDDDVVPDSRFLAAHVKAQAGNKRRVTIGPLLPPPDTRLTIWAAWEERTLCRQYNAMIAGRYQPTHRQFYTGNASVLRQNILDAGGFDPKFSRAEDIELALRLHLRGLHFTFLPDARGWHYISRSFDSWKRIPIAYAATDVAMVRAGYLWGLESIAREFRHRHPMVRLLARCSAGRPAVHGPSIKILSILAQGLNKARTETLGYMVCALIFNECYYDGLAQVLGGRAALEDVLRDGQDAIIIEAVRRSQPVKAE